MKKPWLILSIIITIIVITLISSVVSRVIVDKYSFNNIQSIGLDEFLYGEEIVEVTIVSGGAPEKTVFSDEDLIIELKESLKDMLLKYTDRKDNPPGIPWQITIANGKSEYTFYITDDFKLSKGEKNYLSNKRIVDDIIKIYDESKGRNGSEKMY